MRLLGLIGALAAFSVAQASAISRRGGINPKSATVKEVFTVTDNVGQYSPWLEKVYPRSDGSLLIVRLDIPELYIVDPKTKSGRVIATFSQLGVTGAFGITEYAPDVFAVAVGNYSLPMTNTPGTFGIASVDLSKGVPATGTVKPTFLARVPAASGFNGLTFRPPSTLYAADSFSYRIFEIDTKTKQAKVAAPDNSLFEGGSKYPGGPSPLGVMGLLWDARKNRLVFTNEHRILLGYLPANGSGLGQPQLLANGNGIMSMDDFGLDPYDDNIYVPNGGNGSGISYVSSDGKNQFVINAKHLGPNFTIGDVDAARFGQGNDSNILYATTANYFNATGKAQVLAYEFAKS